MLSTRTTLIFILLGAFAGTSFQLVVSGAKTTAPVQQATITPPQAEMLAAAPPASVTIDNLTPPPPGASRAQWLSFAHQVSGTKTGSRHDNRDYTSPLLPWYVYIARQSPEAIYSLYQDRTINKRILGHLIQFGLLPEWYQQLPDARKLLLNEPAALINLAVHHSSAFAREELISLLREYESQMGSISAGTLLFAISGMQDHELESILSQLQNGTMRIDPRSLRHLMLEPRLENRDSDVLAIMRTQEKGGYNSGKSRSMSSYFLHGAELGAADYVEKLIHDAKDNNDQPTNFYCAACSLALVSEGLVGADLIDAVTAGKQIKVEDRTVTDIYFEPDGEKTYLLNIAGEVVQ